MRFPRFYMYSRSTVEKIVRAEVIKHFRAAGYSEPTPQTVIGLRPAPPYELKDMRRLVSEFKAVLKGAGTRLKTVFFVPLPYVCVFSEAFRYDTASVGICGGDLNKDTDLRLLSDLGCNAVLAEDVTDLTNELRQRISSFGIDIFRLYSGDPGYAAEHHFRVPGTDGILLDVRPGDAEACGRLISLIRDTEV